MRFRCLERESEKGKEMIRWVERERKRVWAISLVGHTESYRLDLRNILVLNIPGTC